MSIKELKDEVAHLAPDQQRELIAYMVSLQTERDTEFRDELKRKIDDRDPSHWVDLDELQKKRSE